MLRLFNQKSGVVAKKFRDAPIYEKKHFFGQYRGPYTIIPTLIEISLCLFVQLSAEGKELLTCGFLQKFL